MSPKPNTNIENKKRETPKSKNEYNHKFGVVNLQTEESHSSRFNQRAHNLMSSLIVLNELIKTSNSSKNKTLEHRRRLERS